MSLNYFVCSEGVSHESANEFAKELSKEVGTYFTVVGHTGMRLAITNRFDPDVAKVDHGFDYKFDYISLAGLL